MLRRDYVEASRVRRRTCSLHVCRTRAMLVSLEMCRACSASASTDFTSARSRPRNTKRRDVSDDVKCCCSCATRDSAPVPVRVRRFLLFSTHFRCLFTTQARRQPPPFSHLRRVTARQADKHRFSVFQAMERLASVIRAEIERKTSAE